MKNNLRMRDKSQLYLPIINQWIVLLWLNNLIIISIKCYHVKIMIEAVALNCYNPSISTKATSIQLLQPHPSI